jgi:CHAT domain-containing protein
MSSVEIASLRVLVAAIIASSAISGALAELQHQPLSSIATAIDSSQDQQEIVRLESGKNFERTLTGSESHTYQFALPKDNYGEVIVEQRGVDVVVQVLDPAGKLIAEFDSESRKEGRELVGVVADAEGSYQLRIKATYPRAASGLYEIQLVEVRPGTDGDRSLFESHKLRTEALAQQDVGKYDVAIGLYERARESAEKGAGPNDAFVGDLLFRIAVIKRLKGDYAVAESLFERAVAVDQKAVGREHPQTALVLRGWGTLYLSKAEYAKAEPLLQESLEIYERTLGSDHPTIALSLRQLANLHGYLEDLDRARAYLERALPIAEKGFDADDVSLIAVVHDLGDVYRVQEDFDRAEPLLQRALDFTEKKYGPENIQLASPLHNLGNVAAERKEYVRALELYGRSHAIREKVLGAQHPDTVRLLMAMANVYGAQGDYARALGTYQRALDLLTISAGPYHRSTAVALDGIARFYAALGNLPLAIQYQERYDEVLAKQIDWNLTIGSDREKLAYLKWISSQTDRTVSLHVQLAPDHPAARDLALSVLLQRKGRGLDAVSGSMAALRQRLNSEDRKLLDELSETYAKQAKLSLAGPGKTTRADWEKQLADLAEQRELLETKVSERSGEFRAETQQVTVAAVREALPADAALIEFAKYRPFDPRTKESWAYGKPRYVAYILRRAGDVQWRDLGPTDEVDSAAAALRESLRDPRRGDVRELARTADRKILAPVRDLLGDPRRLLISPDGDLNLIPFQVLLDEQGHFLLQRYSITYLTTGRDLLRMQVARKSQSETLVIANPLFGEPSLTLSAQEGRASRKSAAPASGRRSVTIAADMSSVYFAPLSGTALEARNIQRLFPEARVLTGEQAAKRSLLQAESPRILHIATHGFFLEDALPNPPPDAKPAGASDTRAIHATVEIQNPLLRSGLALAGANLNKGSGDDGILTALEASNLNLWGTKLVTLSACDTGVGEVKNGEGVYGLRRAFFLAGTESLVMSLWPVSDYVTRELMTEYYAGLKKGLGRGEALRQAQLEMLKRKDRQHPFYWASFIQAGEWANLDGQR